jgi:hypothetical protein
MAELVDPDVEHLRLLSIFYYVDAGLQALSFFWGMVWLAVGILLALRPESWGAHAEPPPAVIGLVITALGIVVTLMGLALAVCLFFAGRMLSQRRRRLFCLIVAGINCIFVPIGTVLGVCTLLVLIRPSVKALFESSAVPVPADARSQ